MQSGIHNHDYISHVRHVKRSLGASLPTGGGVGGHKPWTALKLADTRTGPDRKEQTKRSHARAETAGSNGLGLFLDTISFHTAVRLIRLYCKVTPQSRHSHIVAGCARPPAQQRVRVQNAQAPTTEREAKEDQEEEEEGAKRGRGTIKHCKRWYAPLIVAHIDPRVYGSPYTSIKYGP